MSLFSVEIFCLTVPKIFVVEPFCVSENIRYRKILWIDGGDYQGFPLKVFCLTVPINFVGEPFRVLLLSGIEKFYASEGYVTIFCRNFLSHGAENFRSGALLRFRKYPVSKNFMDKMGGGSIKIFR